jgi:hypothetical protein
MKNVVLPEIRLTLEICPNLGAPVFWPKVRTRGSQPSICVPIFTQFTTLLTSVCTGSWVYAKMGLLDGLPATNRKEPDRAEAAPPGKVPIDRLAEIAPACRISHARVVDAGRIITAGGITSGMEMGFYLLRRAGYDKHFLSEVARVMEYSKAYALYREDVERAEQPGSPQ